LAQSPLLRLVALAGHVIGQRWEEVTNRQHGMTGASVSALLMITWGSGWGGLREGEPRRVRATDLAGRLWVRPATATGIIDTLAKAGYVRRERDTADRRAVWIVLTDAGLAQAHEIGMKIYETFVPEVTIDNPEHERIIRGFLIELVTTYLDRESIDGRRGRRTDRRGSERAGEAVPET
jgi:DNA-binding MarR family transcriptional regulator